MQAPQTYDSAGFDELDSLLEESVKTQREIGEAKEALARKRRGGQSREEAAADAERIRVWQERHEWKAIANVGVFLRTDCQCGMEFATFEGLMFKQSHRHLRESYRYVQADAAIAALPNETVVRVRAVACCEYCAETKGWVIEGATEWEA